MPRNNSARMPSHKLTYEDAVAIHSRYRSGEFQNRIAAHFDVNPGRVNEVLRGKRFPTAASDPRL